MNNMSEEVEKVPPPNWEIVEELFDTIDELMDKAFHEKKANFIEMDIVLMMLGEKLRQEKHFVYNEIGKNGISSPNLETTEKKAHFYG